MVREVLVTAIDVVTNPRKRFDEEKLKSLAASIEKDGLVQPILVRPTENGGKPYELVSGERRLRAHVLLGRDMIPSTIREMDEKQAARIRLVENLHREDLHELDEAEAFHELLEDEAYTVELLATECGRSESYVYQRLKLLEYATEGWLGPPTTAQLQKYIASSILLQLGDGKAPFDPDDAELVPSAGPCATCPKRTGNVPGLWPELEGDDRCTDRTCFETKRDAAIAAAVAGGVVPILDYGSKPPKSHPDALTDRQFSRLYHEKCKEREKAVYVAGRLSGERVWICRSAECPKHGRSGRKLSKAEKKRRKEEKERTRRAAAVREIVREKVLERVDVSFSDTEQLRFLVRFSEERMYHEQRVDLMKQLGFEGKPRRYGTGKSYDEEMGAWIAGQDRDQLVRSLVRIIAAPALGTGRDWRSLNDSQLADFSAAFGYQIHNAVRSVQAAAELALPEDS